MAGPDSRKLFSWERESLYTWVLIAAVASGVSYVEAEQSRREECLHCSWSPSYETCRRTRNSPATFFLRTSPLHTKVGAQVDPFLALDAVQLEINPAAVL